MNHVQKLNVLVYIPFNALLRIANSYQCRACRRRRDVKIPCVRRCVNDAVNTILVEAKSHVMIVVR